MVARAATEDESAQPRVTIVVSFRERWRFTALTVASILEHTSGDVAVWLLDPGMPDAVRDELKPHLEAGNLELVAVAPGLQPNQWRAQIAPRLTSPFVVFIDNDVVVTPGWLERMIECAEETGAGIVCPLYLWGKQKQSDVIHMAGGKLDLEPAEDGLRMAESHRHVNRKVADVADELRREPCGFGEYHCLMMRREIYSADNMFDPQIVTVHEHIHASMLAREMGFETWFEPRSEVNYLALAEWRVGELGGFRSRWNLAEAESSLAHFARRWNVVDDADYHFPVRKFLIGHAGRSDVLDPRPGLGARRGQAMTRSDLEASFAGLQWLAAETGYDEYDIVFLCRAYRLATALTEGLYRPCGRPFINHLAGTASVLLFYGCPLPHVLASLLHASLTHGPKDLAINWLARFATAGGPTKPAADLAILYAKRSKLLAPLDLDTTAIDQLPIEAVGLHLVDAANEIDMRLSLEVAVSGRTDVYDEAKIRAHQKLLERVGLSGMAATLGTMTEWGQLPAIPFKAGQVSSFRLGNGPAEVAQS